MQAVTLKTPPGPTTAAQALAEACDLFDRVEAGIWSWPDPEAVPAPEESGRLAPGVIQRLIDQLHDRLVGERVAERTWLRMYLPFFRQLLQFISDQSWEDDQKLLEAILRQWPAHSRARQMAHDRLRALWREAHWPWPEPVVLLRGNGRAAAAPQGVRSFSDSEVDELRARIQRSRRLTPADLVAWDLLTVFGLRPAELQGLELSEQDGTLIAKVTRTKKSSRGSSGPRLIPAVPPAGWPVDCHGLLQRLRLNGLPDGILRSPSPGQGLTQQLRRLQAQPAVKTEIPGELTSYAFRHAFALRLGVDLGLSVREAAELMGHTPAAHLSTYGRRLDAPRLQSKVAGLVRERINRNAR
ncbi:hypothetical protein ICNINCKA_01790 [Synechococcus sp. CBW1107]|nr:hypothetical protein ICNINCKA_01790 [Synechococcus sp. CBW1107]